MSVLKGLNTAVDGAPPTGSQSEMNHALSGSLQSTIDEEPETRGLLDSFPEEFFAQRKTNCVAIIKYDLVYDASEKPAYIRTFSPVNYTVIRSRHLSVQSFVTGDGCLEHIQDPRV